MARQRGPFKKIGTIHCINYYKTRDGWFERAKPEVDPDELKYGKRFAGTRRASKAFGYASTASRLIRSPFSSMLQNISQRDLHNYLLKHLTDIIARHEVKVQRVTDICRLPLEQLTGLSLNPVAPFSNLCDFDFRSKVNAGGQVSVIISPFNPMDTITFPKSTTHFCIQVAAACITFAKQPVKATIATSPHINIKSRLTEELRLRLESPSVPNRPLFVLLAVSCFQYLSGQYYDLANNAFYPVSIINIAHKPSAVKNAAPKKVRKKVSPTKSKKAKAKSGSGSSKKKIKKKALPIRKVLAGK